MRALRSLRRLQQLASLSGGAPSGHWAAAAVQLGGVELCSTPPAALAAQLLPRLQPWQAVQVAGLAKAAKQKGKKGGAAAEAAPAGGDAAGGGSIDLAETRSLMDHALDHLHHELASLRSGRATPGMLDHMRLEVYGEKLPLKAVGTVSVRDSQLLVVTVFDPSTLDTVVRAIQESPLQLNPRAEGQEVLVPIPRPTSDTLAAMARVCRQEGETAKVSVRHARKLAMDAAKALPSEDERKRVEKEVQRLTDDFIAQVERSVTEKERQIKEHTS